MSGKQQSPRRGSIVVMSAVCLVVIFALAAFTVDVGHISLARTQIHAAADAAALAGAAELNQGEAAVRTAADAVARQNFIAQAPLHLVPDEDVELGKWDEATRTFTPLLGAAQKDADSVRVTARLDSARENSLRLFFAPLIGFRNASIQVKSVATNGGNKPRDIMLVIDCSGSMDYNDRMVYTHLASLALIEELGPDDRLGLAVYSYPINGDHSPGSIVNQGGNNDRDKTEVKLPLTGFLERALAFDHAPVRNRIPQLTPAMYANMTNIGGGMRVGLEELLANDRPGGGPSVEKVMVLMTDGHANVTEPPASSPTGSVRYFAELAADHGVIIHGIALGMNAEQGPIRQAASISGGQFHYVPDGDLKLFLEAYRSIGQGDGRPKLVQ